MNRQTVAILGASDNPERYSYKALKMLQEYNHRPILINPTKDKIEFFQVHHSLADIQETVDTLTVYIKPELQDKIQDEVLNFKTKRIIFNPGSENPRLERLLMQKGIETLQACTLVLLRTSQF